MNLSSIESRRYDYDGLGRLTNVDQIVESDCVRRTYGFNASFDPA